MSEPVVRRIRKSYEKSADKFQPDDVKRFKWYLQTFEETNLMRQGMLEQLPAGPARVLDVGCGAGHMAELFARLRPDLEYEGFDIVEANVEEAHRRAPAARIYQGNFWEILRDGPGWDYIISCGVLFTVSELEDVDRLFQLVDAKCRRGFVIVCTPGTWGMPTDAAERLMEAARANSTGVTGFYHKGKRDFLPGSVVKNQKILVLLRDGWAVPPPVPAIPPHLTLTSAPEAGGTLEMFG